LQKNKILALVESREGGYYASPFSVRTVVPMKNWMTCEEYDRHRFWMGEALKLAHQAGDAGDVPVGAILIETQSQNILAQSENRRERDQDPTAHAEVLALRTGGQRQQNWHLNACTLYVTLEPCPMCSGAIVLARLGCLVYGADDPKTGAIQTVLNLPDSLVSNQRLPVIKGILESDCRSLLQNWFAQRREGIK